MDPYGLAYRAAILLLGLSMLSTFAYSLFAFPDQSVSRSMLLYPAYMWAITACLAGHTLVWLLYLRALHRHDPQAVEWGYATILGQAVGWTGLVVFLEGTAHVVFVAVFSSAFLVTLLILCHLVLDQDLALLLRLSVVFSLFCNILMLVLFSDPRFYIPEHLAFMVYALFFAAFFCAQPYGEWGRYCAAEGGV
jgi:hypothetical protein